MSVPLLPEGPGLTKYSSWGAWYQDGLVKVPYVRKIATNGRHFAKIAKFECGDTAELVRQFLEEYQVKLGHTYLLDTALGAYEAWGSNNNGDAWRESDLLIDSDDRGYRSFKKHAHVFRHHKNQDPALSVGRVVLAAYNRDMKRVEVIEELDNFKGGDLLQKWANEGSLPTSMGGKVPWDECSICGNRAPSAKQYCDHAKYAMNRVWEDGRKVCVFNPNMKFFDQSHVIIPAEKIAGTMMKVASANGIDVEVSTPDVVPSAIAGDLRNVIEISEETKVASEHGPCSTCGKQRDAAGVCWDIACREGENLVKSAQALAEQDPTFPIEVLEQLAQFPLHKIASTLTYLGIVPKPEEWQYLVLAGQGHEKLAKAWHEQGICFDPDVEIPEVSDLDYAYIQPQFASRDVAQKLAGLVEGRSVFPAFLAPRMEKIADDAPAPARKGEPGLAATMAALGISYGLVRAIQGSNAETLLGVEKATGTKSVIAAMLIAAGVAAALNLGGHAVSTGNAATKLSSLLDEPDLGTTAHWGCKVATSKGLVPWVAETPGAIKSVVLPFSIGYMGSAYYRAKQMQGQPTTSTQNLVADHPLAAGVGAVGAVAAVRRAFKR